MTDQNMIPADKVQELADKYDNAPGNPDRLLVNAIADLRALLPAQQPGEAWLVNIHLGDVFRQNQVALKYTENGWISFTGGTLRYWLEEDIALVAPLTPERPASDLQAKYDALEDKHREAQERIKALEQASTPRTVATPEEYDALPIGSRVQSSGYPVVQKGDDGLWRTDGGLSTFRLHAGVKRTVLRYGRGDEQPVWRIEHDAKNLRVGEYIIDCVDDGGTVEKIDETGTRRTDAGALGKPQFAPFIVFPNRDAATPEAIEEAKKARDKEMEE